MATQMEINKQEAKFGANHHVIDIHSLDEALERIQPYSVIDDKGNEVTHIGYLAGVEQGATSAPKILKPAVHLQHAYEYLVFEPNKKFGINMQAYRSGKHKSEARKLDKFWMAIKEKLVAALPEEAKTMLEWEFPSANLLTLGTLPKTWEEYADMCELEPHELPVILQTHDVYFRESTNPDLQWALHLPQKICSPLLLLNRNKERDPTDAALNKEAAALFQFKTAVWCKKPPSQPKSAKKRKVEEATGAEEGEVEAATEVAEEEEEILAQVPLPLPEPEEVPVLRLTRTRRVDTA